MQAGMNVDAHRICFIYDTCIHDQEQCYMLGLCYASGEWVFHSFAVEKSAKNEMDGCCPLHLAN